jgi:hypothetical protein
MYTITLFNEEEVYELWTISKQLTSIIGLPKLKD